MVNSKDEELELTEFGWKDTEGVEYATDEEYFEKLSESKEDTSSKTQALTKMSRGTKIMIFRRNIIMCVPLLVYFTTCSQFLQLL